MKPEKQASLEIDKPDSLTSDLISYHFLVL